MVGWVGNLCASVEKLGFTVPSPAASSNSSLLHPPEPSSVNPKIFYRCFNSAFVCGTYITDEHGLSCPDCKCSMTTVANYLPSAAAAAAPGSDGSGGQVVAKGLVQGT
ncbi:hypothetical protein HU200_031213 [Digitaria exilis]|uniref:Uncharacterized protein n=1 Tax=Digitaria exilis TaxID=1010633 RepID=A0A835BQ76_9POAL|nr:hypothetical protein HU200_031213 [Digitaria exilis]